MYKLKSSKATTHHDRPLFSPTFGLLIGVLAASTSSILIRFAQVDAPTLAIAAYRLGIATLLLTPVMVTRHRQALQELPRNAILLAIISGSVLGLHFAMWIASLEFTSVVSSVAIVQTSPLFVAILSPLILKESIGRNLVIGMVLAFMGSVIVALSDACVWQGALTCPPITTFLQGKALQGDLLALGGAIGGALYLVIGRRLRARLDLLPYIFLVYGAAALWLILAALVTKTPLSGYAPTTFVWFFLLALLPQLLAHSTYNWALRYLSAALVSIALLGETVASTVWAYWLLNESPPILRIAGAAFILFGIAIASWRRSTHDQIPTQGANSE